jgi:predicted transcriptional regulator
MYILNREINEKAFTPPQQISHMSRERELWAKLLSSDVKIELLQLFRGNPKVAYSADEVAKQIGRNRDELETALNDLVEVGVIRKAGNPGSYQFDEERDREVQARISSYLLRGRE